MAEVHGVEQERDRLSTAGGMIPILVLLSSRLEENKIVRVVLHYILSNVANVKSLTPKTDFRFYFG